ncbi:hypothetical protein P3S68_028318 [Capsicum galapagoense]
MNLGIPVIRKESYPSGLKLVVSEVQGPRLGWCLVRVYSEEEKKLLNDGSRVLPNPNILDGHVACPAKQLG